jgi:hypothetical protein
MRLLRDQMIVRLRGSKNKCLSVKIDSVVKVLHIRGLVEAYLE